MAVFHQLSAGIMTSTHCWTGGVCAMWHWGSTTAIVGGGGPVCWGGGLDVGCFVVVATGGGEV